MSRLRPGDGKEDAVVQKSSVRGGEGREWRVVGSVLFASCSRRGPSARAGNKFVSKSAFVALCALRVRGTRGKKRAKSRRKKGKK